MRTEERDRLEDPWLPARSEGEWLMFYLRGLTFVQIARWCRVNAETVRHSIRQREAIDPSITDRRLVLHDGPRYRSQAASRDHAWDKRYAAVFRFVAEQGHFPKQLDGPAERRLQRWLYTQRIKLEAGELDARREELLDRLGEWR